LVTSTGDPVLGDNGPITMPAGKVAISPDGTLSLDGAVSGKLRIVEFPQGTQVTSLGNSYYSAPANAEQPATQSSVRQGFLENSNVNPDAGMVELVEAQQSAEIMQRALAMFNSEMDKTATQDLPKAG
jgi:flagellar basal body rod protein FlgG